MTKDSWILPPSHSLKQWGRLPENPGESKNSMMQIAVCSLLFCHPSGSSAEQRKNKYQKRRDKHMLVSAQ